MNDLQAKFAIALLACGLFFAYAFPKLEQAKHDHDAVIRMVREVYNDANAPSGNVMLTTFRSTQTRRQRRGRLSCLSSFRLCQRC
jgi:hypothetical protein